MTKKILRPFQVGFLLVDGFALISYSAAIEPLRAANQLADGKGTLYDWSHIAVQGGMARSSTEAIIECDYAVGDDLDIDLLLVVAGGDPFAFEDEKTFAWLRKLAARGKRIGGISGGPIILVKAGLMDGRRMTVHWEHSTQLSDIAPNIALTKALYVMDRDRITCAGGVAPLDFMHAIITNHHGAEFARKVSDWFLHTDIRPPGGAQRAGIIDKYGANHPAIVQAIEAMENHIGDPLKLDDIAAIANCTARHLNRLFVDNLKLTTMTFYRHIRLNHALQLLKQTSLSLTDIAYDVGFSSSAHFAKNFKEYFKIKPSDIRQKRM